MATFVHITAAKFAPSIRRSGLGGVKRELTGSSLKRQIVFCFPVLGSHTLTHQWSREILKWRRQPLIGVYFRVPDDEVVVCCRFNEQNRRMAASEAVALVRAHQGMEGFEVIVERKILAREIRRIAPLRGVIGWRHYPQAHGRAPCACEFCQRGEPNSRRIMARARRDEASS
jgi:hypothetical protein